MRLPAKSLVLISLATVAVFAVAALWSAGLVHHGFSTRDNPGKAEAALARFIRDASIPSHYRSLRNPVSGTPEVLHEGMAHWADHCASCHGNKGDGETMYGRTMSPRPPDMRQSRTQAFSDGELYYTIKNGVRLSGMPAFGEPGDNDIDTWKLVAFIRHLPQLSQDEELQMEELNPKSPDEMREELEEQQFLNGGEIPAAPKTSNLHH